MDQSELNRKLQSFLISKREAARLSQSDVAARSAVFGIDRTLDQRAVSRLERQPLHADAIKIAGYLSAVGVPVKQYYDLLNTYTYQKDRKIMAAKNDTMPERLASAIGMVNEAKSIVLGVEHEYMDSLGLDVSFDQVASQIKGLSRKPVIGFFGPFDAGKTTLVNTVIHSDLLPARYQPATCIVNLLMHIDDKPGSISGTVALFRKGFKPHMVHDPMLVAEYLIEEGGTTILDRLGMHNYDEEMGSDAYMAIIFSDADLLRRVWLLDTPGDLNSSDGGDTEKALGGVELADGIVFISPHTGFFKDSDLGFAANIIRQRPPMSQKDMTRHLLFVQSHCHAEIRYDEIRSVGEITFKRLRQQFENLVFSPWKEEGAIEESPTPDMMTARVQPFWRESEAFRLQTLSKINEMAEYLVAHHERVVEKNVERALSQLRHVLDGAVQALEGKKQSAIERIHEVEAQDARFRQTSEQLVGQFKALIESCSVRKADDLKAMEEYYRLHTSEEGLTELIKDTYSDKKEAQAEVGVYIGQLLTARLESVLKSSGKEVSIEVEELLKQWQEIAPKFSHSSVDADVGNMDFDVSAFNARAAFVGGLAGLGSLGAMALYVSTIASNLGAYILVGKAAGVIVSLGLAGSVTTVTSFVAAIGGPITIGIAIAAAIGYLMYRLAGRSWQKALAKKLAAAIRKEDVWGKVKETIDVFWDSTEKAILAGLKELVVQTDQHIATLKADAGKEYNVKELDECILTVKRSVKTLLDSDKSSGSVV